MSISLPGGSPACAVPALLAALWMAHSAAHAQANAADETQLAPIQVTGQAPKSPADVTLDTRGLPTATTVIGRDEIAHTNLGRDYTDLLRRVPGVNAFSFGQGDIGSPVKMRGFTGSGSHGATSRSTSTVCRRTSRRPTRAVPA